jgi:heat shock protein HtpX
MKYVGIYTQIWRNNLKSVILLILFPLLLFALLWLFLFFLNLQEEGQHWTMVNRSFLFLVPWVGLGVLLWFIIAYFSHSAMIRKATGSVSLERSENKRVYNLVENMCIELGMKTPAINIIQDDSLNAFASGIEPSSYTISLSKGIIEKLNDDELQAVIAHELTHIRNRDVRLLIVSIIFVGIFAFLTEALFRSIRFSSGGSRGRKGGGIIIVALILAAIGYLLSMVFRFAISRKREYMADSGSAEITRNPFALASALEKISTDSEIEAVERKDVAQLFIENPQKKKRNSFAASVNSIFSTHPPIEKRIEILRQF